MIEQGTNNQQLCSHGREGNRAYDFISNVNVYPRCSNVLETGEPELKWDNASGAEVSAAGRDRQRITGLICLR